MPVLPGIATPTELSRALALGVHTVKVFPAEALGGAALVAALAAPFPEARFVPTGGLGAHNATAYLRLPSVVAIGGSWMVAPELLEARDWDRSRASPPTRSDWRSPHEYRPAVRHRRARRGDAAPRPREGRIRNARGFRVWEGGGEYNVARGLRRCFGLRAAVATALVDNEIGRLVEDCMLQGGVDTSHVIWRPFDGIGRALRNGLNFTERGFGLRGAVGVSDRGHTAAAGLRAGDIDWHRIFRRGGAVVPHGRRFRRAVGDDARRRRGGRGARRTAGATVSYDLNYRPSLWKALGGSTRRAR